MLQNPTAAGWAPAYMVYMSTAKLRSDRRSTGSEMVAGRDVAMGRSPGLFRGQITTIIGHDGRHEHLEKMHE